MNRYALSAAALALAFPLAAPLSPGSAQEPTREIVQVSGDLYRAQSNNAFTVFLVTPEGIILADPISTDFATWLKSELDRRFGVPVRYVLYSHHHWDHGSGGAVFADEAELIAHENLPGYLSLPAGTPPLPPSARDLDANANGRIERGEAQGALQSQFDLHDADGNGVLSAAEVVRGPLRDVHPPTVTFSDRHTVSLGGKRATIVHVGTAHSRDMSVVVFPEERVLFGTDVLQVRRLPIGVDPTLGEWVDAYRVIDSLDFDTVVPGHGEMGTKADITAFRRYLDELGDAVSAAVGRGRTLEEMQAEIRLDAYRDWARYEAMLPVHVEQVHRIIKGNP